MSEPVQPSHMRREIDEIAAGAERLLTGGREAIIAAADTLRAAGPHFLVTAARGSSDHAATYLKYACELTLGLPVASIGPSVCSVYGAPLNLTAGAAIGISQSGKSPDIVSVMDTAAGQGVPAIAITNAPQSPLADASTTVIDILAGPERSVAATKSFVLSAVAGLAVLAHWKRDQALINAIDALPACLDAAARIDWPELRSVLAGADSLFVLGRGPVFAMANEAALKFKETCRIHAESYSSAEVLHGPVSIVGEAYPILAFSANDAAAAHVSTVVNALVDKGAVVFAAGHAATKARALEVVVTGHPLTDPLALIASFYAFIERLARDRGFDPDRPRNLNKVTETV